jgi:hypothetical protein
MLLLLLNTINFNSQTLNQFDTLSQIRTGDRVQSHFFMANQRGIKELSETF